MKVLVDTSAWIDYFKGQGDTEKLDVLIDNNALCVCGIILAELLPILTVRKEYELLELLKKVPVVAMDTDWERIISYQVACLENGLNKIGIADLMIVDSIITHDLMLFTHDNHFSLINKHIEFKLYS